MSGWKVVPVEPPIETIVNLSGKIVRDWGQRRNEQAAQVYRDALAAAPEPDWPALTSALIEAAHGSDVIVIKSTDSYRALTAAVRATFGSKP